MFVISVAAELSGLHAQTLRSYDRLGLVSPGRTAGGGRRYSARDIALLREVQRLSQEEGVNLAGIKRIIELEQLVDELRARLDELAGSCSPPTPPPSGRPRACTRPTGATWSRWTAGRRWWSGGPSRDPAEPGSLFSQT